MIENLIVLEYSMSQDAFHQHPVSSLIMASLMTIASGKKADYLVVGVFATQAECDIYYNTYQERIRKSVGILSKGVELSDITIDDLLKTPSEPNS